jgi:hypothetical protein
MSRLFALFLLTGAMTLLPAQSKSGSKAPTPKPPKPGLVSCAGKIEGRYAESSHGQATLEFRSGKATLKALLLGSQVLDCWTAGKKIYLYMPGDPNPMEIDINDDGTLQAPMGEFKKKGS